MKAIPIHDAKTNLSKYIAAAKEGETVYIGSFGNPEVILIKAPKTSDKREFGSLKNKIYVSDDAFSRETDEEISRLMYGQNEE